MYLIGMQLARQIVRRLLQFGESLLRGGQCLSLFHGDTEQTQACERRVNQRVGGRSLLLLDKFGRGCQFTRAWP